ncbi:response regulator [Microbulbifer magnicolonia]|uniref:response regulator n=1 Tax=Microbulbifer magnicolonia TaxID=3109744 RepID=UPI002B412687|nr:response regulator [Microbulbifer sp. GG15]
MSRSTKDDQVPENKSLVSVGGAATLLGVSRATVQRLVDQNQLQGMRTLGGHRRILISSLTQYLTQHGAPQRATGTSRLKVLIAEDNLTMQHAYDLRLGREMPQVDWMLARDAVETLLIIERNRPHVLIVDLVMKPFDGFHLINQIYRRPEFSDISIIVVTALDTAEIAARGGLPPSIPCLSKPAPWERLFGYLEAHFQLRFRKQLDEAWLSQNGFAHDEINAPGKGLRQWATEGDL